MKKLWVLLLPLLFVMTGCGGEKLMTCTTSTNDVINGYKLDATYKVYSENGLVKRVVTTEELESESEEIVKNMKTYIDTSYTKMNENYGGYDYKITDKKNGLKSEVTIDYSKMDLEKFVKDQPTLKTYVNKENKLKVEGLKSLYEAMGATCEQK